MEAALGPHTRELHLLGPAGFHGAPATGAATCPLLRLGAPPLRTSLRSLHLRHIAAAALPALSGLERLESLEASVHFPDCQPDWLGLAAGLTSLRRLALAAAVIRLQPEAGLAALAPLSLRLVALRLGGCLLLTDPGATALAALSALTSLEVTPCGLVQAGVDCLAAGLTRLHHAELRQLDGVAPRGLLLGEAEGGDGATVVPQSPGTTGRPGAATAVAPRTGSERSGSTDNSNGAQQLLLAAAGPRAGPSFSSCGLEILTAHVARVKALSLLSTVCQLAPGIKHLEVRHTGATFLLGAPPPLGALAGCLEILRYARRGHCFWQAVRQSCMYPRASLSGLHR